MHSLLFNHQMFVYNSIIYIYGTIVRSSVQYIHSHDMHREYRRLRRNAISVSYENRLYTYIHVLTVKRP